MDDMEFNNYPGNNMNNQENEAGETGNSNNNISTSFYSESYIDNRRKRKKKIFELVLVSLLSSIFGGGILFLILQVVMPAVQPSVNGYFNQMETDKTNSGESGDINVLPGVLKKIEIEKSESPVTAVAEKVSPSIVGIRVTSRVDDFFFGERERAGEGSGIIIRADGYILTNNHVIEEALIDRSNKLSKGSKIEVILPNMKDEPFVAEVVGRDRKTDLAVLKIDAKGLPAAEFGDSDSLKPGELAIAIGNPGGLEYMGSITVGVISGLNRTVQTEDGKELKLIQTDAAINPGNSGGALVNSQGLVIGVNTIKIAAIGYESLGFAIPINTVKEITDNLIEYKYVIGRPYLGIYIENGYTEEVAKRNGMPAGIFVADVEPLSGAYKAGIKRMDVITKFNDVPVKTFSELEEEKNKHKPGDVVTIEIYREGKTLTVEVELGEDKG